MPALTSHRFTFHGDVCENHYLNHAQLEYTLGELAEEKGLNCKTGPNLRSLYIKLLAI
jgi:hypothetical protein